MPPKERQQKSQATQSCNLCGRKAKSCVASGLRNFVARPEDACTLLQDHQRLGGDPCKSHRRPYAFTRCFVCWCGQSTVCYFCPSTDLGPRRGWSEVKVDRAFLSPGRPTRSSLHRLVGALNRTASFQKFNLEEMIPDPGRLNLLRAFLGQDKQWFWDSRPSS